MCFDLAYANDNTTGMIQLKVTHTHTHTHLFHSPKT